MAAFYKFPECEGSLADLGPMDQDVTEVGHDKCPGFRPSGSDDPTVIGGALCSCTCHIKEPAYA